MSAEPPRKRSSVLLTDPPISKSNPGPRLPDLSAATLRVALSDKQSKIAELEARLASLKSENDSLRKTLEEKEAYIVELKMNNGDGMSKMNALVQSYQDTMISLLDPLKENSKALATMVAPSLDTFNCDDYSKYRRSVIQKEKLLSEQASEPTVKLPRFKEKAWKILTDEAERFKSSKKTMMELKEKMDDFSREVSSSMTLVSELSKKWLGSRSWDQRVHFLWEVTLLTQWDFRWLFGEEAATRCGHFLECQMSGIICDYGYWVDYPVGDTALCKDRHRWVESAVVSKDGRYLFVCGVVKKIECWDLETDGVRDSWECNAAVTCLALSSRLLVSGHNDGSLLLWDVYSHIRMPVHLAGHNSDVTSVGFDSTGDRIVSSASKRSVRIWSAVSGWCLMIFKGPFNRVSKALFVGDNEILASLGDSTLRKCDALSGESETIGQDSEPITDISLNCEASLVACAGVSSTVKVCGWPGMESVGVIPASGAVCFHPLRPDVLACGSRDSLQIFAVPKCESICMFGGLTDQLTSLCFTPDGSRVVSVCKDNTMRLWDVSFLLR